MNEVAHFMIYSEIDETCVHMPPEQRTSAKQIENDTPASDLGMMVAARMVLPSIAKSVGPGRLRQSSDENFRAEHPSFQAESQFR
jgi:hypothetical protein